MAEQLLAQLKLQRPRVWMMITNGEGHGVGDIWGWFRGGWVKMVQKNFFKSCS